MPRSTNFVVPEPLSVPEQETASIAELHRAMESGETAFVGPDGRCRKLPRDVYPLFLRLLDLLQRGQAVSIIPHSQELTTQQAADLLGMSRQFFVRLLDEEKLPYHRVGTHRRIHLKDLLDYKSKRDQQRHEALGEMARLDVEMGVYDQVILPDE